MKPPVLLASLLSIIACCIHTGCKDSQANLPSAYHYKEPVYAGVRLKEGIDSLHFALPETNYNMFGSFNYFTDKGRGFISFYDLNARALITYDFASRQLVHKIPLKNWFLGDKLKKACTYVVNFDSIFVITGDHLFLVDSSSAIKKKIEIFQGRGTKAYAENGTPAIFTNHVLYTGIQPDISQTSLDAHRNLKVICGFNLANNTKELYYQLPDVYRKDLYGYSFLDYSYCVNDKGNFVFSFPADTNIYETNLADVHNAYFGKSQFQQGIITPLSEDVIKNGDSFKEYSLRDSYGPIYYDPYKKRYLRIAKQRVNEADLIAKNRIRKKSVLIFNEQFKIIGECPVEDNFAYKTIFFTPDGSMYTRVNARDEHALHFVKLNYADPDNTAAQIAQHKIATNSK